MLDIAIRAPARVCVCVWQTVKHFTPATRLPKPMLPVSKTHIRAGRATSEPFAQSRLLVSRGRTRRRGEEVLVLHAYIIVCKSPR